VAEWDGREAKDANREKFRMRYHAVPSDTYHGKSMAQFRVIIPNFGLESPSQPTGKDVKVKKDFACPLTPLRSFSGLISFDWVRVAAPERSPAMNTPHRQLFRRVSFVFSRGGAVAMRAVPHNPKSELKLSGIIVEINDLRELPSASIDLNDDRWRFQFSRRLPLTLIPNFKEQAPKRF
jgi:hypothetical protein